MVYIYPMFGLQHDDYAARFVASYNLFPPRYPHQTVVVSNGRNPTSFARSLFLQIPSEWFYHDNTGWDIGAYQALARTLSCDVMLCFGQSVYFHKSGWMRRIVDAWQKRGPGYCSGTASYKIRPHLQTTGFWCPPRLIADTCPNKIISRENRYEFEHGVKNLGTLAEKQGLTPLLVTWDGEYRRDKWRTPPNIIFRGDQTNCLYWTNHSDLYMNSNYMTRMSIACEADGT